MKRNTLYFILFFLFSFITNAEGNKSISLSFSESQFSFIKDTNGYIEITSKDYKCTFDNDITKPGLPLIPINVVLNDADIYNDVNVQLKKRLIMKDVEILHNPQPLITGTQKKQQMP